MKGESINRKFTLIDNKNNEELLLNNDPLTSDILSEFQDLNLNPFNLNWKYDNIEKFLTNCGYFIVDKTGNDGETIKVAAKSRNEIDLINVENIMDVFDNEVQNILLKWLLKNR